MKYPEIYEFRPFNQDDLKANFHADGVVEMVFGDTRFCFSRPVLRVRDAASGTSVLEDADAPLGGWAKKTEHEAFRKWPTKTRGLTVTERLQVVSPERARNRGAIGRSFVVKWDAAPRLRDTEISVVIASVERIDALEAVSPVCPRLTNTDFRAAPSARGLSLESSWRPLDNGIAGLSMRAVTPHREVALMLPG